MKRIIGLLMLSSIYCPINCDAAVEKVEPQQLSEEKNQFVPSQTMIEKFKSFCDIIKHRDFICEPKNPFSIDGKDFSPEDSYAISKHLKSGGSYKYNDNSSDALRFQIEYSVQGLDEHKLEKFSYTKRQGNNTLNLHMKDGGTYVNILTGYDNWDGARIKAFANNVLTILKRKTGKDKLQAETLEPSLKIGALILTSERLRSEKSLLLAYVEFLKLKCEPSKERLDKMFFSKTTLRFPGAGGQDKIFFTKIPELVDAFSDLGNYAIIDTNNSDAFFDKIIWKLWKMHEVYHEYSYVIDKLSVAPIDLYVSYIIIPLINSAPNDLKDKLYSKFVPIKQYITDNLKLCSSKMYTKFIFMANPECCVESTDLYIKSALDRCYPSDTKWADWLLTTISKYDRNVAKKAIMNFIGGPLLGYANITHAAYFSFSKLIEYTDQSERKELLMPWVNYERYKPTRHLTVNLKKAIEDEQNDASSNDGAILRMATEELGISEKELGIKQKEKEMSEIKDEIKMSEDEQSLLKAKGESFSADMDSTLIMP